MLVPTLIMGILALVLAILAYRSGEGKHIAGMRSALNMTVEILPLLFLSFVVAGMVQVLVPQEVISRWVGAESGFRGLAIGTLAGGLTPGGPYVSFPIAAGLLRTGASIGTVIAYLTGWSLWSITGLPLQVGIVGWRFTLIRLVSTFFFPPIAGWIAQLLFARLR